MCTAMLNVRNFEIRNFEKSAFTCFVGSQKTAIVYLDNINWLVLIDKTECAYCVVGI